MFLMTSFQSVKVTGDLVEGWIGGGPNFTGERDSLGISALNLVTVEELRNSNW